MEKAAAGAGGHWTAWDQLGIQLLGMAATIGLASVSTLVLCILIEKTLGFRIDPQGEAEGLDQALHGERGYGLLSASLEQ